MNNTNAILNYSLNRFCPIFIVGLILITSFSFQDWKLYILAGILFFMDRYQFKVGYSVGYCEGSGIDPIKEAAKSRKKN
tara:strand:+ start:59 stop:295 length:237 start_codon:yes stop_codon:yes gene_type:complete